jgi:hypothetical protein
MENKLPFGRKNYQWMIIGVVTIIAGFFIMSMDNENYGFGVLGLTVGPVVVVAGFMVEIYAILHRPRD